MIHGIEIEALLPHQWRGGRRRIRLFTQELDAGIGEADLGQDGLQQLSVGFRQLFSEHTVRDADQQLAILRALLPGGSKPSGEAVRIHPPLHVVEDLVPGIHESRRAGHRRHCP